MLWKKKLKHNPSVIKQKDKWILKLKEGSIKKLFGRNHIFLKDLYRFKIKRLLPEKRMRDKILTILFKNRSVKKEKLEEKLKISRQALNNYLRPLLRNQIIKVIRNHVELNINIRLKDLSREVEAISHKDYQKIYPLKNSYFTKVPEFLDEDLAKLLGLIISDGNLSLEGYRVNLSGETSEIGQKIFNKKFGKNFALTCDKVSKVNRLDIYSKSFSYFLNAYFDINLGKKSHIIKVPEQIYNSPESVKAAFLAGLFEGDGGVDTSIMFHTVSKELALGISRLLTSLGIPSKIKNWNVYTIKVSGGSDSHDMFVKYLSPYLELERKKDSLLGLLNKQKRISTLVYPIKSSLKRVRDNYNIRLHDSRYRYLSPNINYRINSNILGYFIKKLGHIENKFVQEVRSIYNSEVVPVRVSKVKKVKGGTMYDLTTEHSNFLAGNIPIIVHNTCMDGLKSRGKVVVIAATNRPNSLDPALRRPGRFDREISIGVPNKKARLNILKIHTRNMPLEKDVKLQQLADITHGFVGADLAALCKEAAMSVIRKIIPKINLEENQPIPNEVLESLIISQNDFKEALKVVRPSALREVFVEKPNVKWEQVGGMEDLKEELKEAIEWPLKNPKVFTKMGIRPTKGILLFGPPGTGKTLTVKAIATESEANFISIKGAEIMDKYVGEAEKAIKRIFQRARQTAPTIIFFDEIDAIAPRRGTDFGTKVTERVVNSLLTEMDGLETLSDVIVVASTNRPDLLDPALIRPGRFDKIIATNVPGKKSRLEIFKVHTKNMPLANDIDIEKLAEKTDGYVGADIEAVCREAAMIALREDMEAKEINLKHFEKALEKIKPSLDEKDIKIFKELEETMKKAQSIEVPNYMR